MTPTVLIRAIFRMIIRFARWFTPNFRTIIHSSWKVAAIFRTIICSSWKFDLLFINRPRAFWNTVRWLKYLNDLFNYCARKKPLICWNSVTAWWNVGYETHLVISQGTLNCWLKPKHQNITVPINKCTCSWSLCHTLAKTPFSRHVKPCDFCHVSPQFPRGLSKLAAKKNHLPWHSLHVY